MIKISGLCKKLNNTEILKDINLEFENGKVYGLAGENGSGKTMLMRAMCGLIYPDSGYVLVDGKRLGTDIDFPESVGVLIEYPSFLPELNAYRNLELLASIKGKADRPKIIGYLRKVSLDPYSKKKYRKFSLGMKQKLGIAAAFFEEPDIIILDEPLNAIDESSKEFVYDLINEAKNRGALIVLSCHDSELMKGICDRIYHIRDGKIENI